MHQQGMDSKTIQRFLHRFHFQLLEFIKSYLPLKHNNIIVKMVKVLNMLVIMFALFYTTIAICFKWTLSSNFGIIVAIIQIMNIGLNFTTEFYKNGLPTSNS